MEDLVRKEVIRSADRVVIKVGTRVLTDASGKLEDTQVRAIAKGIGRLAEQGREIVLVSSGAVGAGMGELGLNQRPSDIAQLQAIAAVGQARLIDAYHRVLNEVGVRVGQVLLTASDMDDRGRYLNVRNTLLTLLERNVVPIVNENDTVATDELVVTFGDNDRLAALVTNLLRAPLLVILSDVDGLYDGPPSDPGSSCLTTVPAIQDEHFQFVRQSDGLGTGGMKSKLEAARMVTTVGESAVVASGRDPDTLMRLFAGEPVGTLFLPKGKSVGARKRWLGYSANTRGQLFVDAGARRAVVQGGKSLLAIGIRSLKGEFAKGDVVSLCGEDKIEFARGLCNYDSKELESLRGLHSNRFTDVLGHLPYEEVIHRDNLLVTVPGNA